jgi:peptide/nickel transport system substrate-binding protein
MSFRRSIPCISGLLIVLALAACNGQPSATTTPELTATATKTPPRTLTVCLGAEPDSLFPLNNNSSAARSVLAAIYDGPIDTNSYSYQPVLLEQIPSLENGDAQLFETSVYVGDEVVDADGTPVTLAPGMRVRPAGCRSENCVVDYDGTSEIKMDQIQATFRLRPGLVWSDADRLCPARII